MTIKVLIADDHKLFRQGLIGLMEAREDLVEVIGEASSGEEALQMVERLRPDVVLMDIYMPEMDGLEALRVIRERFPAVKVVMLTSSESDEHLYRAVQSGASGYLLKNLDADELFDLLSGVSRGEVALTREMASRLLMRMTKQNTDATQVEEILTERELAVLRLVAVGTSNQEIANQLMISLNTVKSHMRSILDKLQLENRTQAANFAMHHGIMTSPK